MVETLPMASRFRSASQLALCLLAVNACQILMPSGLAAQAAAAPGAQPAVGQLAPEAQSLLAKRCVTCHGPDVQEGGLRLDRQADALAGGHSGVAIVPGMSAASRLIRLVAGDSAESLTMPPEGERLSQAEVDTLRAWIDRGAPWSTAPAANAGPSKHWAFQRPQRPAAPTVAGRDRLQNPIDSFVVAQLEARGLTPSPEADRRTLIRRVSLDLTGLPPSPDEVASFLADTAPDAYERLVDRLLESPHFGGRWARHWLDMARYADSSGYEFDAPRSIWRYRDWVVSALNRDLPFDEFVIEQLAGDLLPGAGDEQVVATGFHCNAMLDPNLRWEAVLDRVNTTGTVLLGLTVGCAQCHSHKYDPISQREYFQLYAFFDHADVFDFELETAAQKQARDAAQTQVDQLKKQLADHEQTLKASLSDWAARLTAGERARLPADVRQELEQASLAESPEKLKQLLAARMADDPVCQALTRTIDQRAKEVPQLPATLAMRTAPRETRLFVRGNPERPGEVVTPGVPAFLHPLQLAPGERATRLHLARWLVSPENPLSARVIVNHLWQHYFGQGLVEPANDFGVQTPPPVHQQLLDWLATELIDRGWSLKAVHRLIVCSATYRQSSAVRPDLLAVDPGNQLLARQRRLRVEAEIIRDLSLSVGGLLCPSIGGPSVFPDQPEGVLDGRASKATWTISPGGDRYRRGIYTWTWRLTPHPMLPLFDAPDGSMACIRRDRSNTPIQALTILNDPTFLECARGLARRVTAAAGDDAEHLCRAFQICVSRQPSKQESRLLAKLLNEQRAQLQDSPAEAAQVAGTNAGTSESIVELAAWTVVCRAVMSVDEFISRE